MTDLHERLAERLAGAVTAHDAHEALCDNVVTWMKADGNRVAEIWRRERGVRANGLLNGHSAGWIGIGAMLMPNGWSVTHFWWNDTEAAAVLTRTEMNPETKSRQHVEGRAKRPDTALCLAALRASEAGK